MTIRNWQIRRSNFNHEWLKNKYLNRIDGFLERLKTVDPDPVRLIRFKQEDFREWARYREEAADILVSFKSEMSPRVLFDEYPLKCAPHKIKQWLSQLCHELWLARYPVDEWISAGETAMQRLDKEFDDLLASMENDGWIDEAAYLRSMVPAFLSFKLACQEFSDSISLLPSEVLVT